MRKSLLRMTLRQLQVFRAVCESRSYSRAAEAMALTQPAVSLQIRQLEEQVGLPLFEYVGRKLYLTEAAESLLAASADIFDRLDSLDMNLSTLEGSLRGELRLSAASSLMLHPAATKRLTPIRMSSDWIALISPTQASSAQAASLMTQAEA